MEVEYESLPIKELVNINIISKNIRLVELYKLNGGHIADQPTQMDFQPFDNEEWKTKLENEDVNYFIDLYCKLIK